MPELPNETMTRLRNAGLNQRDAEFLVSLDAGKSVEHDGIVGNGAVAYFDTVSRGRDAKTVFNWCVPDMCYFITVVTVNLGSRVISIASSLFQSVHLQRIQCPPRKWVN